MRLSDSVEGRLIAAMAIAIVTEQEAIQTLTLLAACLRQPSAMGSELLLAKGFSATGVSSFLRMGKSYETSVTIVHDSILTDEAAAVLAAADRLAVQHGLASVGEECLLLALLEFRSAACQKFAADFVSNEEYDELVAYSRKRLKRLASQEGGENHLGRFT